MKFNILRFSLINNPKKNREKIEEIKFLQKQRVRTHGVDVYSLAIGESENNLNDPTKLIEVNFFFLKNLPSREIFNLFY